MLRTCVHPATGSMVETKMPGTAFIKIDCSTPWECARPAILVIITK